MSHKKILASILAALMLIIGIVPAFAGNLTVDNKADALNKLDILRGTNNSYELDTQMTRAMAAAFVVRMLGKEQEVMYNSSKYIYTDFSDVPSTEWYAPYVGYCSQNGIIGGYQGKYNPNDMITEKAFLKILLGVIGYLQDVDFSWDEVYKTAYEKGIVTPIGYKNKVNDNVNYKRSLAVEAMYNTLTLTKKDTDKTVIQNLIDLEAVPEALAINLGLIIKVDSLPTAVKSVTVGSNTSLVITLNEPVKPLKDEDILIYDKSNSANTLSAGIISQNEDTIVLSTAAQEEGKSYVIQFSNVTDMEDFVVNAISKDFTGYSTPAVVSDFFMISKVSAVSEKVIKVSFTQPVDTMAELQFFYEIFKGESSFVKGSLNTMTVKCVAGESNSVLIYLNNEVLTTEEYTLKISGELTSSYGAALKDTAGDQAKFYGSAKKDDELSVISAAIIEKNVVEIVFNKEVDTASALELGNYKLEKINTTANTVIPAIMAVVTGEGTSKGKTVRLKSAMDFNVNDTYTITIDSIKDNIKKSLLAKTSFTLFGSTMVDNKFTILGAYAVNQREVTLIISKRMNQASIADLSKYIITGGTYVATPSRVYYNPSVDPSFVKLYLPANKALSSNTTYNITVHNGVKDEMDNLSSVSTSYTFSGSSESQPKIYPLEAKTIGNNIIKLIFSGEIMNASPNTLITNYTLESVSGSTKTIVMCNDVKIIDAKTVVLRFDDLKTDMKYSLKVAALIDFSGDSSVYDPDKSSVEVVKGQ
ncbi:MAG: S-layer homology domain-containing protein [Bacillota bacterium]